MDETVLEGTKAALSARSGSFVLKNPYIPTTLWLRNFKTWYVIIHRLYYPISGTKYCVTRQWPLPKEQCDVIDEFLSAKHAAGMVRESKSPHFTPIFCFKKPNGIVHAYNKINAATILAQTPIPEKDILRTT